MSSKTRNAFTLIEILIVVVIMAVLAATIIPQFTDSSDDAKTSTSEYNLNTMRAQIELYKAQHGGTVPSPLSKLAASSTHGGKSFDPYMIAIPENTVTGFNTVTVSKNDPIVTGDVSGTTGWIYNQTTGEIRIDHADHWQK